MAFSQITKEAIKANRKLFSSENPNWVEFFKNVYKKYGHKEIGTIASELYMQGPSIGLGNFMDEITDLYKGMFANSNLEEIVIPANIQEIGVSCFQNCHQLRSCEIQCNVKTLPMNLFFDCENLEIVYLPDSVVNIEKNAFFGCDKVKIVKKKTGKPIKCIEGEKAFLMSHFSEEA